MILGKDKKRLIEILDSHTRNQKEIKKAIEIMGKYDGLNYAKKIAQKIVTESWKEADKLLPQSSAKNRLREFINHLIERSA